MTSPEFVGGNAPIMPVESIDNFSADPVQLERIQQEAVEFCGELGQKYGGGIALDSLTDITDAIDIRNVDMPVAAVCKELSLTDASFIPSPTGGDAWIGKVVQAITDGKVSENLIPATLRAEIVADLDRGDQSDRRTLTEITGRLRTLSKHVRKNADILPTAEIFDDAVNYETGLRVQVKAQEYINELDPSAAGVAVQNSVQTPSDGDSIFRRAWRRTREVVTATDDVVQNHGVPIQPGRGVPVQESTPAQEPDVQAPEPEEPPIRRQAPVAQSEPLTPEAPAEPETPAAPNAPKAPTFAVITSLGAPRHEKSFLRELTPGALAVKLAVHAQVGWDGIKSRLQMEGDNKNLVRGLNIAAGVLVVGRVAWAGYAATKGIQAGGHSNHEALQVINGMSAEANQSGSFTDEVAFVAPADPIDQNDLAPAPVALGEWKADGSNDGSIWGSTMDYLEKIGVDTGELTEDQKYAVVDDMLEVNKIGGENASEQTRWDAAETLSSDFEVQLPSANGMEEILESHGVASGELDPVDDTASAPAGTTGFGDAAPDTPAATATPAPAESTATPTESPAAPTESPAAPIETPAAPAPAPTETSAAPAASDSTSPSASATPKPPVFTENYPWYTEGANWSIIGHELGEAALFALASHSALSVSGGLAMTIKEERATKKGAKRRVAAPGGIDAMLGNPRNA